MIKIFGKYLLNFLFLFCLTLPAFAIKNKEMTEYEGPCSKLPELPAGLKAIVSPNLLTADSKCNLANIGFFTSAAPNWLEIDPPKGNNIVFAYVNLKSQADANANKDCQWVNIRENIEKMGFLCNNQ